MNAKSAGYDAPISTLEDDILQRRGFAREVFHIASSCPPEWPVRIGLYGEWGSGKTSVLRLVERLAREKNHIVVWLDPWGAKDSNSLWRKFLQDVIEAERMGLLGPSLDTMKSRERLRKVEDAIRRMSKFSQKAERVVAEGLDLLQHWLRINQDDLRALSEYHQHHRLIVLVDDLDRALPSLLPEILHALKEIFSLPGFSLVMAFDRKRVAAALKSFHPGWGEGTDFIDKVIDFPRWLPTPSSDMLTRLAEHHLKKHAQAFPEEALRGSFEFIPRNPRTLKAFIRNLWTLETELKRYNSSELDWSLLVLAQLFKSAWPQAAEVLLDDETFRDLKRQVEAVRPPDESRTGDNARVLHDPDNILAAAVKAAGVPEGQVPDASRLLRALFDKIDIDPLYGIGQTAFLTERPATLTRREHEAVFNAWKRSKTVDTLRQWISHHAENRGIPNAAITGAIFKSTLQARQHTLELAVDERLESNQFDHLQKAALLLDLLKQLGLDLGGFSSKEPSLSMEHFRGLLSMVMNWAGWRTNPLYQSHRDAEAELLLESVTRATLDPVAIWRATRDSAHHANSTESATFVRGLQQQVEARVAPHVTSHLLGLFKQRHGISILLRDNERQFEQALLFDPDGVFWTPTTQQQIIALPSEAKTSTIIQENLIAFAMRMTEQPHWEKLATSIPAETLKVLWSGVVAGKVNPRRADEIRVIQQALSNRIGALEEPYWLQRMGMQSAPGDTTQGA
jgi:hypothetical protein